MYRKFVFAVFLFAGLLSTSLRAQTPADSSVRVQLDAFLQSAVNTAHFNGSVLVARKGKLLLYKGYGWKDFSGKKSNDAATIFEIASLTKPFTSMLILKLQELGMLSVNDKLNKYFPLQKGAGQITLQNLMNHTSGLDNYTDNISPEDSAIVSHPVSRQRVLDLFENKPLHFKPGTQFEYCNSGYYLLGLIIARVTSMPYEQAIRKYIFEPLGMDHSGFDFIHLNSQDKATGYMSIDSSKPVPAVLWDSTISYAAGGIYSTTGDLYRWTIAIAQKQVLSERSWREAFTRGPDNYGDGWWIDTLYDRKYITHSGGVWGFMSNFAYYPDEDVTIILLNNIGNYGGSLSPINNVLSAILFGQPYELMKENREQKTDSSEMSKYPGTYRFNASHALVVTQKNGQLFVEATNPKDKLPSVMLHAESPHRFFINEAPLKFQFVSGTDGTIEKIITFNLSGKDAEWLKIK